MHVQPSPLPGGPHVIHPDAVYSKAEAEHFLRLAKTTIRTEVRRRRLRIARRAGRYYILGEWLLQWLRDGELHSAAGGPCACPADGAGAPTAPGAGDGAPAGGRRKGGRA